MTELLSRPSHEVEQVSEETREQTVGRLELALDSMTDAERDDISTYAAKTKEFLGLPITVKRSDGTLEEDGWTIGRMMHKDNITENARQVVNPEYRFAKGEEPYHLVEVEKDGGTDSHGNPLFIRKAVPIELLKQWQRDEDESGEAIPETDLETETNPEISPTGASLIRAAERINAALETRAINKAHSRALEEDARRTKASQDEALASYEENIDATRQRVREERIERIEDKLESAKGKVRSLGRTALSTLKDAGLITLGAGVLTTRASRRGVSKLMDKSGDMMMAAGAKLETGADKIGASMVAGKEKVKNATAGAQLKLESKRQDRQFKKQYEKELKAFDKNAEAERKAAEKQDKRDLKEAAREDKRFERSMRKKAALERRQARRTAWAARREAIVARGRDLIDTAQDKAETMKRNVRVTRTAGRMALQTFRDTREAFVEDKRP